MCVDWFWLQQLIWNHWCEECPELWPNLGPVFIRILLVWDFAKQDVFDLTMYVIYHPSPKLLHPSFHWHPISQQPIISIPHHFFRIWNSVFQDTCALPFIWQKQEIRNLRSLATKPMSAAVHFKLTNPLFALYSCFVLQVRVSEVQPINFYNSISQNCSYETK